MSALPTGLTTHTRKIQNLYKRAIRHLENYYHQREVFRYHAALMRQRFEENRNVKDMRITKQLMNEAEKELFNTQHWVPRKFANSPGGVAYGREVVPPDWILDYWHPLEKAQYPEYFAKREQRKIEYAKLWEKQYGKSTGSSH